MIVDNIKNCEKYIALKADFKSAFDFIKKATNENLPLGRYELENGNYAFIQEYVTKDEADCIFEGHRSYIDIQYIISGVEVIKVADISKTVFQDEYNEQKDVQFFADCQRAATTVIEEDEYGIFFPYDIHKPAMSLNGNKAPIKKIVVKVKV